MIRRNAQHRHGSPRRSQQARHEVHQRRLAGAVRAYETGNARRNFKTNSIHAKYLAIELRDVVEDDQLFRPIFHKILRLQARCLRTYFTTSYALTLRDKSSRHSAQIRKSIIQEAQSGGSDTKADRITLPLRISSICDACRTNVPNKPAQTFRIKAPSLMTSPQPAPSNSFKLSA